MERERLGSRLGFILLSAGCAIGVGNVWKFPYMTGQYGGAKDLGTNKEQKITITASTNLSEEEINKAVKEAEQFAEEDKKKREVIDTRNNLDASIMNIEKTVKENEDKLDEADKTSLNNACEEAKKHLASEDLEELKKASEDLMNVANTVFSKMYQNMQQNPQGDNNNGGTPNGDGDPEVVVE